MKLIILFFVSLLITSHSNNSTIKSIVIVHEGLNDKYIETLVISSDTSLGDSIVRIDLKPMGNGKILFPYSNIQIDDEVIEGLLEKIDSLKSISIVEPHTVEFGTFSIRLYSGYVKESEFILPKKEAILMLRLIYDEVTNDSVAKSIHEIICQLEFKPYPCKE